MWPRGFRKKKPYTAAELLRCQCEVDAQRIRRSLGQGVIVHIAPPEVDMWLGAVYPPGGGVITDGMLQSQYRQLFAEWDELLLRPLETQL
jgi:hypothetical protein